MKTCFFSRSKHNIPLATLRMAAVVILLIFLCTGIESACQSSCSNVQAPQSESARRSNLRFEVATIKPTPPDGEGMLGFAAYPSGKVVVGNATVKMLIRDAFDVEEYQVKGGPGWLATEMFDITALPPTVLDEVTTKRPPLRATPTPQERIMLQNLLIERFGLEIHCSSQTRSVYFLEPNGKGIKMEDAKDKSRDARGGIIMKQGGIVDGEAFGSNVTMTFLARQLSRELERPVLDRTGLTGSFDFKLKPFDPLNHDMTTAIFEIMPRLGLTLRPGKGPVETILVDRLSKPTDN